MQLLGTGDQRAAKTARVGVGNQFLTFSSWNITFNGYDADTTNFESFNVPAGETFNEGILGSIYCDLTFGGDWDAGTDPLGTPPGLFPRDDLAQVTMVTSRLDDIAWEFGYVRVRGVTNGAASPNDGKVTFAVSSAKTQGPFTFPTSSV